MGGFSPNQSARGRQFIPFCRVPRGAHFRSHHPALGQASRPCAQRAPAHTRGCAGFCVNGQSNASASQPARKHNAPKKHEVPEELLSGLLANYKKPADLIGENGLLKQLTKLLVEKALDAELTEHLGHEKHEAVANASGNTRNGKSKKTLKGDFGELRIEVPRDRHGNFEPQLIAKHQTRWAGFDDKIISLYARGMTVREIQAHLQEMYGAEVSPSLISSVTDAVSDEVKVWQARPLEPIYPIVYLDCIHVKVREGAVRVKAVYLAIGITRMRFASTPSQLAGR